MAGDAPSAVPDRFAALPHWIAEALGAETASLIHAEKLAGGAIQENWRLDLTLDGGPSEGHCRVVLRTDAPSTLSASHSRAEEFALLQAAESAGVIVPRPRALCTDSAVIGAPFYLMDHAPGTAQARRVTRDPNLSSHGAALAHTLGANLARLHRLRPPDPRLSFLAVPKGPPALSRIARYRADLDALPEGRPVLEHALNWLEDNAPDAKPLVLCHSDYRTGNYLVDNGRLTAILDWEFAAWSDPEEDIGWFCARCWRFGNDHLHAGGIADLAPFLAGYEAEGGLRPDPAQIAYWQVMAELRWAVIALHQAERNRSGAETGLELALSGRMAAEMELNILHCIAGIEAAA